MSAGELDLDAIADRVDHMRDFAFSEEQQTVDDFDALIAEVERLRALELRVRALTTEPGCRHDGDTYCGNAILEALDNRAPTPPVRPVDGGNP